jgi:hypothetical protein
MEEGDGAFSHDNEAKVKILVFVIQRHNQMGTRVEGSQKH